MCYDGKCLHCLEVETGTMIFAIIKVVLTSISTLVLFGVVISFNLAVNKVVSDNIYDPQETDKIWVIGIASNVVFTIAAVIVTIAFAFSVVLLVGVCKRKAGHVKAYFIYGVMNLVVLSILCLITLILQFDIIAALICVGICTINGLILHMIRLTYRKFQAGTVYKTFSHNVEKF